MKNPPRGLLFDVFGTVVDWRTGIMREVRRAAKKRGVRVDAGAFADAWRAEYRPAMDRVGRKVEPWQTLDMLHAASLAKLLGRFALDLSQRDAVALNLAWHRLPPWPDSVHGLARLKRRHTIASLSNGNVALLVDLAKFAGLPWDAVFSAELFGHYKPDPEVYLGAVRLLDLEPREVMLVAAHKDDLAAARACGLRTAFVYRPFEHGKAIDARHQVDGRREVDRAATINATDFIDLARQLEAP